MIGRRGAATIRAMTPSTMPKLDARLHFDVMAQLGRILSDELFASSERTARFLRYVVERTLEGRASEIKELVIAMEVYARTASYDSKKDSTVRVEASRLRAKLERYYEQRGQRDPVRITIPRGAYVPQFTRTTAPPTMVVRRRVFTSRARSMQWVMALLVAVGVAWQAAPQAVPAEALAAWREGNDLLRLDPHSSTPEAGMPPTLARAIDRYELAVAASPTFAPGWASLAEAYEYASAFVGRDAGADAARAETAARRAVSLDPNLPEAHAMLGLVRFYLRWDFAGAEAAYRRAIDLDPRAAWAIVEYADLLRETNRLGEAADVIRRARVLQPVLPVLAIKEAELLLAQGRSDEAIAAATAALDLKRDSPKALVVLGAAWETRGDVDRALAQYRRALDLDARDRRALPALGYLFGTLHRDAEARDLLRRLEELHQRVRVCAYQIAVVHTGLGDHDRALDWLERAFALRQMHVPFMVVEPRFRQLHASPRFAALVRRLGLQVVRG
jgi:tetratricopeptide (TPR) repeat protein